MPSVEARVSLVVVLVAASGWVGCDGATDGQGPECTAASATACGAETPHCLVDEGLCVECLEAGHCGTEGRCVDWTCLPPLAPGFALPDVNPRSATFGETVALSDHLGEVVLVYFAALG